MSEETESSSPSPQPSAEEETPEIKRQLSTKEAGRSSPTKSKRIDPTPEGVKRVRPRASSTSSSPKASQDSKRERARTFSTATPIISEGVRQQRTRASPTPRASEGVRRERSRTFSSSSGTLTSTTPRTSEGSRRERSKTFSSSSGGLPSNTRKAPDGAKRERSKTFSSSSGSKTPDGSKRMRPRPLSISGPPKAHEGSNQDRPRIRSRTSSSPSQTTKSGRSTRHDPSTTPSPPPSGPRIRARSPLKSNSGRSRTTVNRRSQSKLSGDEVTPTKDKSDLTSSSTPEHQNKPVPSTSTPVPPHEERSAPEGTSSPTPRPSDTSEHKSSSSRPNSIPPEGYMTAAEVQKLLKQQELQFEEKLLRAELASGEKEKKLRQAMKDEQKEISNMGETVSELTQSRDALLKLVGQYKGMLASLVSEKEKEKQQQEERIKVVEQEKHQALEDLANVEVAFSDVHRKYERTKQVVDALKRNEETLRGAVTDYEGKLQKQEQKFIEFQKHAEEKIQLANEEFEAMRRANDQEMTKMAALLKKAEMKIMSLQDSNDRKTRENQELTQLCDDLINKVGTSH